MTNCQSMRTHLTYELLNAMVDFSKAKENN